jgi:uncharacterized protein YjbJ (UPF0337 family)
MIGQAKTLSTMAQEHHSQTGGFTMANRDVLQGKWKQLRGKVREHWAQIADHDLDKIVGKREQLVGLVQEKYGYTKGKAEKDVDFFLTKMNLHAPGRVNAMRISAAVLGSLLTIVLFRAVARRLASA